MSKIFIVILGIVILTAGRTWAQEVNAAADNVQANAAGVPENIDDQAIVNDEGYGTDDEEYYGSEEDAANAVTNAQANAEAAIPANAQQPAVDNAVGK